MYVVHVTHKEGSSQRDCNCCHCCVFCVVLLTFRRSNADFFVSVVARLFVVSASAEVPSRQYPKQKRSERPPKGSLKSSHVIFDCCVCRYRERDNLSIQDRLFSRYPCSCVCVWFSLSDDQIGSYHGKQEGEMFNPGGGERVTLSRIKREGEREENKIEKKESVKNVPCGR